MIMKARPLFIFFLLLIFGFALLTIFIKPQVEQAEAQIAATIFPLYDIAQNIAPADIKVALIVPPGASPHTFEPKPSSVSQLQNTKIIFAIGHGLDDWTQTIAGSVNAPVILVDKNINLRPSAVTHDHDADDHHGDELDPHYWLSITNVKIIATNMAHEMKISFPDKKHEIETNLQNYLHQLDAADIQIRENLSTLTNRQIITLHDAWYYFAAEYDLTIVGTFEPTAGREPTPQYLIELMQAIEKSGTKTLYSEPQLSISGLESFITDNNLSLAVLDPIGGLAPKDTFINLMLYNAETIAQNQ